MPFRRGCKKKVWMIRLVSQQFTAGAGRPLRTRILDRADRGARTDPAGHGVETQLLRQAFAPPRLGCCYDTALPLCLRKRAYGIDRRAKLLAQFGMSCL